MAGRERAMAGGRRKMGASGLGAARMGPGGVCGVASPGSGRDTPPRETAYPDTPRNHRRQPVAGWASMRTARTVARATPTTPEWISGYMEQSISC